MQCPVCDEKMREVDKFGVTIDICPGCKGVWLDRGELEKIMAMDSGEAPIPVSAPRREEPRMERRDEYREEYRGDHDKRRDEHDDHDRRERDSRHESDRGYSQGQGQKRRGSWLTDIIGGIGGGDD